MNKKIALPFTSFADAEYECLELCKNDTLTVYISSWEEKILKLIFTDTVQFFYSQGDVIKNVFQIVDDTILLKEALSRRYIKIPENHPYKLFQIEDIYDFPFIQVVAESVNVVKE